MTRDRYDCGMIGQLLWTRGVTTAPGFKALMGHSRKSAVNRAEPVAGDNNHKL